MEDGRAIPDLSQKSFNLSDDAGKNVRSIFQIAVVRRPLMSVGRICDEGQHITFDAVMTVVKDTHRAESCCFHRRPGGFYVAKMKLRNPLGFAWQEAAMGELPVRRP